MQIRIDALYDVEIKTPDELLVNLKAVDYETALAAVNGVLHKPVAQEVIEQTDKQTFAQVIERCKESFGFCGISAYGYDVHISAYLPRTRTGEKFTCPRRMTDIGPWGPEQNEDEWELIGNDSVCSYCGSLSPASVLSILRYHPDAISPGKPGKWYLHRPDVPNSGFGGIKYYRYHDFPGFLEKVEKLIDQKGKSKAQ